METEVIRVLRTIKVYSHAIPTSSKYGIINNSAPGLSCHLLPSRRLEKSVLCKREKVNVDKCLLTVFDTYTIRALTACVAHSPSMPHSQIGASRISFQTSGAGCHSMTHAALTPFQQPRDQCDHMQYSCGAFGRRLRPVRRYLPPADCDECDEAVTLHNNAATPSRLKTQTAGTGKSKLNLL